MIYNNKELETNVYKGETYVAVLVLHNTETQNTLGRFSHVQLFATPWTASHQAPLSVGFSKQEYWSGLPCPSPGGSSWLRDGTQVSCIAGRFFTIWATWETLWCVSLLIINAAWNTPVYCFLEHSSESCQSAPLCSVTDAQRLLSLLWSLHPSPHCVPAL